MINFDLLSENEKRMLIAQDVIDQLNSKHIVARHKTFFWNRKIQNILYKTDKPFDLKPMLPTHKCEVCVKGALFVADVLRNNNFVYGGVVNGNMVIHKLKYFDLVQLNAIELAYEGFCSNPLGVKSFNGNYNSFGQRCMSFHYKHNKKSNIKKMILIMQNIINNDGTFIP